MAQYLPGQPQDTRPEYQYDPETEKKIREAYEFMLKHYPAPSTPVAA